MRDSFTGFQILISGNNTVETVDRNPTNAKDARFNINIQDATGSKTNTLHEARALIVPYLPASPPTAAMMISIPSF